MLQQKQRIAPLREIIRNSFNFPKNKVKPRATCSHEVLLFDVVCVLMPSVFCTKKEPLRKTIFKEVNLSFPRKALEGLSLGFSFSLFCCFMSIAKGLRIRCRLLI